MNSANIDMDVNERCCNVPFGRVNERRDSRTTTRPTTLLHSVVLAIPPTITVLIMIGVVQGATGARFVFAALAASAFLIYREPHARANHVSVVAGAQLIGLASGTAAEVLAPTGYAAEAVAMLAAVTALIAVDYLHAPAVGTALLFADVPTAAARTESFVANVFVLAILCFGQRALHRRLQPRA